MNSLLKLSIASFIPIIATAAFYLLEKHTGFAKIKYNSRQIIIGVVFGAIAVLGTEWGIPIDGATVNCRDAAPLCAGLFFGGPAGIIAGVIGGVERWIAVAWGVGYFTRVACSVSTVVAGFYAAALRKYLFNGKRPGWAFAASAGVVMEAFHLTMVFVTNLNDAERAAEVVVACTSYMLIANGMSVLIASAVLALLSREQLGLSKENVSVELTVQRWLLLCVLVAFALTSFFIYLLQNRMTMQSIERELIYSIDDVASDIQYTADDKLLTKTYQIAKEAKESNLKNLIKLYQVDEINMVDKNGIIFASTNRLFLDFDVHSGEQSSEFLVLLNGATEYVQALTSISYDDTSQRKYAGVSTSYGFIQVGYYASTFNKALNEKVVDITRYRRIGETGEVFIIDQRDKIFSGPQIYINYSLKGTQLLRDMNSNPEDTVFTSSVWNGDSVVAYRTVEGFRIIAYMNTVEAYSARNTAVCENMLMEILIFGVLFVFMNALVRRLVIRRIQRVNSSLAKISSGDLEQVVDVRDNMEFAQLSDDINATVATLKDYIGQAEKRMEEELEFAQEIQTSSLPNVFPAYPKRKDFDIFSSMDPAKEVGGDFYDFYLTNFNGAEALNFLVADVSGKGIPAALFMMKAKTTLKNLTESGLPMEEVFCRANNDLCEGNKDVGMFVTALQGRMDLKTGAMTMVNAGHNPPLVKHAGGKFEYVKLKPGLVLAGMDGISYRTSNVEFSKGDTIFLYTDGVTEATNSEEELYGEDRLLNIVNTASYTNMEQLCKMVRRDIDKFVGNAPQFDDITMTAINYNGAMEKRELYFDNATLDNIADITDFVEENLDEMGCPLQNKLKIDIIVDEIFSNICNYAYDGDPGVASVIIEETQDPHGVKLIFTDHGKPYNPLEKDDPDTSLSLENRKIGGLGIFLVKNSVDEISYEYLNERNILTVKSYF